MTMHDTVGRQDNSPVNTPGSLSAGRNNNLEHGQRMQNSLSQGPSSKMGDLIFRGATVAAGALVVALIALIGIELVRLAVPSLMENNVNFLTSSEWRTEDLDNLRFGIFNMLKVTVLSSVFALMLAVPVSIGIATFLVEYAPEKLSRALGTVIDLLAAVPSIIYGMWGIIVLGPYLEPISRWLNEKMSWFFLFGDGNVSISGGGNIFTAGIVLAIMILPIITSISREVIRQTPRLQKEAAMAMGATRWETLRMTAFPYARSGMIAASMLALGRALGETIAVLIILRSSTREASGSLFDGGYTFASKIASGAAEFVTPLSTGAYIAAGLVLFLLTFFVNAIARVIAGGKVNG